MHMEVVVVVGHLSGQSGMSVGLFPMLCIYSEHSASRGQLCPANAALVWLLWQALKLQFQDDVMVAISTCSGKNLAKCLSWNIFFSEAIQGLASVTNNVTLFTWWCQHPHWFLPSTIQILNSSFFLIHLWDPPLPLYSCKVFKTNQECLLDYTIWMPSQYHQGIQWGSLSVCPIAVEFLYLETCQSPNLNIF